MPGFLISTLVALAQQQPPTWLHYPERAPTQPMPPGGWPGGANDPHYYLKLLVGTLAVVAAWLLFRRITGYRFPMELPDDHPWWKPPPSAGRRFRG